MSDGQGEGSSDRLLHPINQFLSCKSPLHDDGEPRLLACYSRSVTVSALVLMGTVEFMAKYSSRMNEVRIYKRCILTVAANRSTSKQISRVMFVHYAPLASVLNSPQIGIAHVA